MHVLAALAVEAVPTGPSTTSNASDGFLGWFLENAWLIPLIPALSFVAILFCRVAGGFKPLPIPERL